MKNLTLNECGLVAGGDANDIKSDAKHLAEDTRDAVADKAEEVKDAVKDSVEKEQQNNKLTLGAVLKNTGAEAADGTRKFFKSAGKKVHDNL